MLSILAVRQFPFINGGPIDQLVDIDVLHQKSGPIDQSDQLINGAQHLLGGFGLGVRLAQISASVSLPPLDACSCS
jgi:hypothetical protein